MKVKVFALALYSTAAFAHHKDTDHKYHPKSNFMFNYALSYDDKLGTKIKDDDTFKSPKAAWDQWAKLGLNISGIINDNVNYKAEIRAASKTLGLTVCDKGELWVNVKAHDMVTLRAGCLKVEQGGWSSRRWDMMTNYAANPAYWNGYGFKNYQSALALGVHAFGNLTVQLLVEDKKVVVLDTVMTEGDLAKMGTAPVRYHTDSTALTPVLSWDHNFSGFKPLLQFGMYDDFNSMFFVAGVGVEMQGLNLEVDYGLNMRATAAKKDDTDDTTTMSAYLSYDLMGMMTPYLNYSQVDVKKKNSDKKYNLSNGGADFASSNAWDDNGSTISGGFLFNYGAHFHPYFAFDMVMGKFKKSTDEDASSDKTNMKFSLGLKAQI
jgi:hypothetical protein